MYTCYTAMNQILTAMPARGFVQQYLGCCEGRCHIQEAVCLAYKMLQVSASAPCPGAGMRWSQGSSCC